MQEHQTLPENIVSASEFESHSSGVSVHVTQFFCKGEVLHQLKHTQATRLSVVLEEVGGECEPRIHPNRANPIQHMPHHMHFAPAGMEAWGYTSGIEFVKDATLSFDPSVLSDSLGLMIDKDFLSKPNLRFWDNDLWNLVNLLAPAVIDEASTPQLYRDGLCLAISAKLFSQHIKKSSADKVMEYGLAPWRLRRVIDFLQAHFPERISLQQLSELTGLSASHFSKAFKQSTGMAPYQWQLNARIKKAQTVLLKSDESLDEIASKVGFADGVHFGRTFRKLTGETPATWRKKRKHR